MSKTSAKTDIFENSAFDTSRAADQLRAFAEKGAEQSREAYARFKTGADEAQKAFESTYETARSVGGELSLKSIAAMRANAEAGFSHLEALVAARSVSEMVELQTAFLRKRVETGIEQFKDFQTVSAKAAEDLAKPARTAFEKSMTELKVA